MPLFMLFFTYQVLSFLAFPGILVYLLGRKLRGKSVGSWRHRLGFLDRQAQDKKVFWIHAVSVGEVLSVEYFIEHFKAVNPGATCYLTTGTITGMAMAKKMKVDHVGYLPFDLLPCMLTAFNRVKPSAIILIEAELWPNLLMLANMKQVPLYLLNGRISQRAGRLRKIGRRLLVPFYLLFDHIFVQSHEDQTAFINLKIPVLKMSVLGNIKAYNVMQKKQAILKNTPALGQRTATNPILLVGSLHPGELDIYLNLFTTLKSKISGLKMIIAPRHFHWQADLLDKVKQAGLKAYCWSPAHTLPRQDLPLTQQVEAVFDTHDLLLVCTLGHLFALYSIADLFFLGGTFVPVGGHNLLEPAAWGVPSIVGPYHNNCKIVANHLATAGGLFKVSTLNELNSLTETLLKNESLFQSAKSKNIQWIKQEMTTNTTSIDQFIKKLSSHHTKTD